MSLMLPDLIDRVRGFDLPAVDPRSAATARVRWAGVAARTVVAETASADSLADVSDWDGPARRHFDGLRARCARDVGVIADIAARAQQVLADYETDALQAIHEMRDIQREVERVRAEYAAAEATVSIPGGGTTSRVMEAARTEPLWQAHARAEYRYRMARSRAAGRFADLVALVPDPLTLRDHLEGGVKRFGQDAVVAPVTGVWNLTGAAATDRETWVRSVQALPETLESLRNPPPEAGAEAIALEEWQDGRWGEALGAVGSTVGGIFSRRPIGVGRFDGHRADPRAPRPQTQSIDELYAGVDLASSEHHGLGHTLRRHVVDDDYLQDRLTYGTLRDDGSRDSHLLREASTWTDRATAEAEITKLLGNPDNRKLITTWLAEGDPKSPAVFGPVDASAGRVMTLGPDGKFTTRPATRARVILGRDGDDIFVITSYLD